MLPQPVIPASSDRAVLARSYVTANHRRLAMSSVTDTAAASSTEALAHFSDAFRFETDCADVHAAMITGEGPDFVLVDVRSHALYDQGHVPGALSIPHGKLVASKLATFPPDTLFVVYCAGPHCNGAARGAMRLAALGRPVKLMAGGITGWLDEGFALQHAPVGEVACAVR
jgi:rhodanese-related sulfurtransferase